MTSTAKSLLDDALGALHPFYEEGDDGAPIFLSLEAIAGLLADDAGTTDSPNLVEILSILKAPKHMIKQVADLYEAAQGGAYGQGLWGTQIVNVNRLVEELADPLRQFVVKRLQSAPKGSPKKAVKRGRPR